MPGQLSVIPSRGCPGARRLCRVPLCQQQRHSLAESPSACAETSWVQSGNCGQPRLGSAFPARAQTEISEHNAACHFTGYGKVKSHEDTNGLWPGLVLNMTMPGQKCSSSSFSSYQLVPWEVFHEAPHILVTAGLPSLLLIGTFS